MTVRVLLGHSVPWEIAALALAGYVVFCTIGVFFPRMQMYGDVVLRGPRDSDQIALTFDDGPHPTFTRRVLSLLAEGGHRATFFVIGEKAEKYCDVIAEIAEAGHELAVHSYRHERLYCFKTPERVKQDVESVQNILKPVTGRRARWFRPPVGFMAPPDGSWRHAFRCRNRCLVRQGLRWNEELER